MEDQTIRLNLQSNVPEEMAKARAAAAELNGTLGQATRGAYEVAGSYEVLTTELTQTDAAFDKMLADAVEATRAQKIMAQMVNETAEATKTHVTTVDAARHSTAGFGQSALQASYAIQDFAVAGVGGVLNNIPNLTMSLGLGAGVAGALQIVAVAAASAGPVLKELGEAFRGADRDMPLDRLGELEKRFKANKDALEEMAKAQHLTSDEVDRANQLTQEQLRLEKQLEEERRKKADREKADAMRDPEEEAADKRRAKEMQASFGDPAARAGLTEAVLGQLPTAEIDRLKKLQEANPYHADTEASGFAHYRDHYQDLILKEIERRRTEAKDVVSGALVRGTQINLRPGADAAAESDLADVERRVTASSPEAKAEAKERAEAQKRAQKEAEEFAKREQQDATKGAAEDIAALNKGLDARQRQEKQDQAEQERERLAEERKAQARARQFATAVGRNTPIDEAAGAQALAMSDQGASEEQIVARLTPAIARAIHQTLPRADPALVQGAAGQLAQQAAGQAMQGFLKAGHQGADLSGQTLGLMGQFNGQVGALGQRQQAMQEYLQMLQAQNAAMWGQMSHRPRSNLRRGGYGG